MYVYAWVVHVYMCVCIRMRLCSCLCSCLCLGVCVPVAPGSFAGDSDVFEVGGYEWKLEMYPYGDSQSDKTLSVFLCAVDRKQLPGWSQTGKHV